MRRRSGELPKLSATIDARNVSKQFQPRGGGPRVSVFEHFDFCVPQNGAGITVLLGASGCGKTTLLKLLSGLLVPDEGQIRVLGDEVVGGQRHSAMVSQAYTCFPWLTALANVEFGLALKGVERFERRQIAEDYLTRTGLGNRLNAYPAELSGGMQQRVAIARTLAVRPAVMFMDEPFGALDAQTRNQMQQLLLSLWSREQNVIVFVTHDVQEAALLADRIIVLPTRPVSKAIADVQVPFGRPRSESLLFDALFVAFTRDLRMIMADCAHRESATS